MLPLSLLICSFFCMMLLIGFYGFLAFLEAIITNSHKTKLERILPHETQQTDWLMSLIDDPEEILSIVQAGITLLSIIMGSLIGTLLAPFVSQRLMMLPYADQIALILCILVITYLNLLLGEYLPKKIAIQNPEKFLLKYRHILKYIEIISRPFLRILSISANALLAFFGINTDKNDTVTEDEVKDLIEQGMEEGTFAKEEQKMVDCIFHLSDQTAYSLMTPRTQMLWLDLEDSLEHNLSLIQANDTEIFLVGRNSLDDFCGLLYTKDLLNAFLSKNHLELSSYIRKPVFVPRSMEAFVLLEQFRKTGLHEAVVLDEYGGVIGFITLNDILTEIIDEPINNDEPEFLKIIPRNDHSWYAEGLYPIDDFKEKFSIVSALPDEEHDQYQTLGGFLTSYFGYIPKVAEICTWNEFTFKIIDMDRARINKILIIKHKRKE